MLLFCHFGYAQNAARILHHGFEEEPAIGQFGTKDLVAATTLHAISQEDAHSGNSCERFLFFSQKQAVSDSRIVIASPHARVFNELKVSLWVRSDCSNVQIGLKIKYPHQIDPRTNLPLEVDLFGTPYSATPQWQQLVCSPTEEILQSCLIRVRSQISDGITPVRIDEREAYVDQILVQFQIPAGRSVLQLDDLEFGPVVQAETIVEEPGSQGIATSKLSIENDRIRKNGEPFFPIITLYHAEALELIARTGVNMLWIRDYDDRPLLTALSEMDIGAIAYPPQPAPAEAILGRTALPSMPDWTAPIWAWMLGINLPASDRQYIAAWADQVRDADRKIHRPIIADVAESERDFHRKTDLISISRFGMNTSHSSLEHYDDLRSRRALALPGKQVMTFVQTEASSPLLDYFGQRTNLPIIEPEQILHQSFEAVAAGFKGVGFWKQIPFDTEAPGLSERMDAIRIFSIHARLIESFIATGRIVQEVTVQIDPKSPVKQKGSSSPLVTRWDRPVNPNGKAGPSVGESPEIRATVFHTEYGLLILLVWHEPGAQCVPGTQTASNVRVLIGGIGDVASACEVTPTSVGQSNLAMERVSGGTELTLKEFDQYATILVTSTPDKIESVQKQCWAIRQQAAESYVRLAESKLERVRAIQNELNSVGSPPVPNADYFLEAAGRSLEEAKSNLSISRSDDARLASQRALQLLRALQRQHWELAVAPMLSPTATLEATNFQTLPDHWKLINRLGRSSQLGENRLPSGDFENESEIAQADQNGSSVGWASGERPSRFNSIRLVRAETRQTSHLSLMVNPDSPAGETASIVSPPIDVSAGETVVVTGQVNILHPLSGADHRLEIYDTLAGREGALVLKQKTESWTPFRIVRHAEKEGTLRLRFELKGPGIVEIDSIRVHVLPTQARDTVSE